MSLEQLNEFITSAGCGDVRRLTREEFPADLPDAFDRDGVLRPMPASWWEGLSDNQRGLIGHHYGLYGFPTYELVEELRGIIAGREDKTMEIGAGNGGLCRALGIRGIDNYHQQDDAGTRQLFDISGVPPVNYGSHVEKIQATDAMRKFKPKIVIACWVTHKYNPLRPHLKGNMVGIDEHYVLNRCDEYIFIGSATPTHRNKPLFADLVSGNITSHEVVRVEYGPHIQSRSASPGVLVHIRRKGI